MQDDVRESDLRYALVFFALPILYSLTYARYAISDVDEGFILAYAWRIFSGEVPYRDFIYIRPPLTIYLHSLTLYLFPDTLQVVGSRALFYLFVASYSYLGARIVSRFFGLREMRLGCLQLAAISFVFSVHNFPPMPWNTVDGILFSTLGLFLLTGGSGNARILLGCAAMFLAAMTKQPFYLMPAIGLLAVWLFHSRRRLLVAAGFSALMPVAFLLVLAHFELLGLFFRQTTRGLGLLGLLRSGVYNYASASFTCVITAFFAFYPLKIVAARYRRDLSWGWMAPLALSALFGLIIARACFPSLRHTLHVQSYYDPQLFFLVALVALLGARSLERNARIALSLLLAISWCSGITYGWQGPGLGATPLVFGVFLATHRFARFEHMPTLYAIATWGGVVTFAIAFFFHYQTYPIGPIRDMVEMGDVFPKLRYLRASPKVRKEYIELKELIVRHGEPFTTVPELMWSNYLSDTTNPMPIDMVRPLEMSGEVSRVIEQLESSGASVFLQKSAPSTGNPVVDNVRQSWTRVESGTRFDVYRRDPHRGDTSETP
jgi:hypothetical protein